MKGVGHLVWVSVAALVGCGAELNEPPAGSVDARGVDGPMAPDAAVDAMIDARPCTGGQGSVLDTTTNSCFVYFTGPLTYVAADAACTAFGSRLAVIKSAATNAAVRSLIGLTDAFVGADDRTVENAYRWRGDPGDPVLGGYTNWRLGEPNNGGGGGVEEDCMIIEGDQNGTWDDRPCDGTQVATAGSYAYICQF